MKTITILIFTLLLNACGSSQATANLNDAKKTNDTETLNGNFIVFSINNENNGENLTLKFNHNKKSVSGFSGCNSFFGNYTTKGNTLTFKDLGATKMYCMENQNLVESKMMKALNSTTNFKITNNKITLLNKEKELLVAHKTPENKAAQETIKIEYRAHTRGYYNKIVLENKSVSVQNHHAGEPIIKPCNTEDWNAIIKMVSEFNLESMESLEAPSKTFQYDAAPIANFIITKNGNTYKVPVFDDGNPNKEIAPLIEMVKNSAKPRKEKTKE